MTRAASPRLASYATLGGLGLVAALAAGRPELAALAVPFVLVVGLGLALSSDPAVRARVAFDRHRLLEGEELEAELELVARRTVPRLEVMLVLPAGLKVVEGTNPITIRLAGGEPRTLRLRLRAERWGGFTPGEALLRGRGPFGILVWEGVAGRPAPVRVYPRQETLRLLVRPAETQPFAGDELARRKGEGIEFADVRPFAYGDRVRRVNWRASARRGELWVNEQHPERNTDVVLFLDSFAEARGGSGGTLDLTVRAAASLAERYVRRRDRVGLVSFGGVVRWLRPGAGLVQLYRIVEALLDTQIQLNYAWRDIGALPTRTLPPQALVLALSPLLDERGAQALLDLRARGYDLAVIEVSPLPFVEAGRSRPAELARRIWTLQRETLRSYYLAAGVAVAEWRDGSSLTGALEEVTAFRRHAGRVRV